MLWLESGKLATERCQFHLRDVGHICSTLQGVSIIAVLLGIAAPAGI